MWGRCILGFCTLKIAMSNGNLLDYQRPASLCRISICHDALHFSIMDIMEVGQHLQDMGKIGKDYTLRLPAIFMIMSEQGFRTHSQMCHM